MSEPATKARTKGAPPAAQRAPAKAPNAASSGGRAAQPGLLQGAGPALGLGVQRQVAIGASGDRFEREADAAADRVSAGENVAPLAMSPVTPETLAQTAAEPPKKEKPEEAVQKAEAMPEKKPDPAAPQKAGAWREEPKRQSVQKAEAKPEEKKPDAKPAQKAAATPEPKKPEAAPVQRKGSGPGPEEQKRQPVQKAEAKPEEKKPVQADAAGAGPSPSMGAAASSAIASKGAGKPLEPSTRSQLEPRLGADFGHVRVHDDAAARSAASALNARAFTHGSDIWLGPGASQSDTRLMAHEATHVVQQAGGAQRMVQRANGGAPQPPAPAAGAASPGPAAATSGGGGDAPLPSKAGEVIDVKNKKMLLPSLKIPQFKFPYLRSQNFLTIPQGDRETNQRQKWINDLSEKVEAKASEELRKLPGVPIGKGGGGEAGAASGGGESSNKLIFFEIGEIHKITGKTKGNFLFGTPDELKSLFVIPRWDQYGIPASMDIDHKEEIQLGGADEVSNMQALDSKANRSSGNTIKNQMLDSIAAAVKLHENEGPFTKLPKSKKDLKNYANTIKQTYQITFKDVQPDESLNPATYNVKWERSEIEAATPLKALKLVNPADVTGLLSGTATNLVVFPLSSGGAVKNIPWDAANHRPQPGTNLQTKEFGFKGLMPPSSMEYSEEGGRKGNITGWFKPKRKSIVPYPIGPIILRGVGNLPYTCKMETGGLLQSMKFAELYGFSPIEFSEVTFDEEGLFARGKLLPSLQIFKKLPIDILVRGDDVSLEATLTKDAFALPGPLKVTEGSLTLSLGDQGPQAEGRLGLIVERLGEGSIEARVGADGLEMHGAFDFDKKVFDNARIELHYVKNEFSGSGVLGIPEGKIRGIKSASIRGEFAKDEFGAQGTIVPDIPAVQSASLSADYKKETGLKFSGDLALKNDTPGIAGGSIHIEALKPPDSDEYKVKGSGSAKPKIPGIDSELKVTYDDGTFDASVTTAYNKGRLKGSIMVGATNRPVTEGQPGGAPAPGAKAITVYGGGSVTVVIAPWLQGTVGVRIIPPNGEVELSGEIGLPSTLDVFPEKKLDKNIVTIGIDIPIVGVAVAGQRIGIFANISGGLDVSAGIGPGQLQELSLKITYNPSHEENTQVSGKAKLHVPAHAGLRLFVRGGIGAGIPIVSAEAGLEIGASLGLEGALDTGVEVDWSPAKGLTLDAEASVYVEPKLKVDLSGFVTVDADLFVTTVNLYEKHWQLAAFEYGSNLRFGVSFPVHYQEGQPFDLSLDKVQFQVPQIEPKAMLSDLIARLA